MGETSFPLDGLEGASEVWPRQRDTRIPAGTWETGGCLALSDICAGEASAQKILRDGHI